MKLLSRLSCLFLGLLFIFLTNDAIAGTCDSCAACINDIKGAKKTFQVQKVIDNYQCFKSGDKYVLNFVIQANFDEPSQPIVIKPNEGHVLEISNLNLAEIENVDKDLFLIINGPNVSINASTFTGGSIEITSSNVSISGGTVGGITIESSASDVVISNVDIASNGGTGIDVAGQRITIAQPDFLGDIATPILLAEGANAGVKSIDTSKVWRKMSEDKATVKEVVGIVAGAGSVELFRNGENEILYQKQCNILLKENSDYSNSDIIPANSKIFVCKDLAFQLMDYISFTLTDSSGNTSPMSGIELAKCGEIFSVPPPPVDYPTPAGIQSDDTTTILPVDETIEEQQLTTTAGDGIDSTDAKPASSCKASFVGTTACNPNQLLMFLFPMAVLFIRRIFHR